LFFLEEFTIVEGKQFIADNFLFVLVIAIGTLSLRFLNTDVTFIYVLTVGAWWLDIKIKEFRLGDNKTMYADLSFACFISFAAQIVGIIGVQEITRDAFKDLLVLTCVLFALWLQNLTVSTSKGQSKTRLVTKFLCTVTSVTCILLGPQILTILKGT
jgi:hypothetical protein